MSRAETRLAIVLALAVAGFATDALHGISPARISLAACIVCLLPCVGLVSPRALAEQVHLPPLLYVAGFLRRRGRVKRPGQRRERGAAALAAAGAGPRRRQCGGHRRGGRGAGPDDHAAGLPAVMTPLARELAAASGLSLETVLMLQVPVFSTVILPYQSPPIMIAMQLGGVGLRHGTRLCPALAGITVLVLLPLDYLWWRVLGYLH